MHLEFSGEIWYWRGPSPFWFVTVPDEECRAIGAVAPIVTYGWGMIPVAVELGASSWATALWPKDGAYIVPIKQAIQRAEDLALGDVVDLHLAIAVDLDAPFPA